MAQLIVSGNATASQVLTGSTFSAGVLNGSSGTMPNNGAITITPNASNQAIVSGYHNGSGVVPAVVVPAANVLTGTTIAGTAGSMPNNAAVTITASGANQAIPSGYHNGSGSVPAVVVPAANVLTGTTIAGTAGTMPNKAGTKNQICGYENITELIPHPSDPVGQGLITGLNAYSINGYIDSTSQIQMAVQNLVPANIKAGTIVGRNAGTGSQIMTGTFTSDANATAAQLLASQTAYVNGAKVTGSMPNHGNTEVTARASVVSGSKLLFYMPSNAYHDSNSAVSLTDPNFIAGNILSGKSIFGVSGNVITGKRWASGSGTNSANTCAVSGLAFTPSFIVVEDYYPNGTTYNRSVYSSGYNAQLNNTSMGTNGGTPTLRTGNTWTVGAGSFSVPSQGASGDTFQWFAVE